MTSRGREFHVRDAAAGKAQFLSVTSRLFGGGEIAVRPGRRLPMLHHWYVYV